MMTPLFVDNHLLVADKPWGLLTQPSGRDETALEDLAREYIRESFHKPGAVFLEAVHRIDRAVGGVVLFARTSKALSRLNAMQRAGTMAKRYLARVSPPPRSNGGCLEDWLRHGDFRAVVVPPRTPEARLCRLNWRCMERCEDSALLEIELLTGRYHQIRAQLAHAGMPILGDERYGAAGCAGAPQGGIALLSSRLDLEHPVSHERLSFESRLRL